MNNYNKPPQMPANQQQVPDHRMEQMQERLRQLELQNTQLRTTVDFMRKPQAPGQPPQTNPAFKPEVEEAIKQTIQSIVGPMQEQHRQQVGYLADQLDQQKFQTSYAGNEKFQKLIPKVEELRQQALAENRYMTREEALRLAYFEETGKKNVAPEPQQQKQEAPVYDPFFNAVVDPQTGKPFVTDPYAPVEDPAYQPQQQQPQWNQQQMQPQQFQQPQQQQTQQPQWGQQAPQQVAQQQFAPQFQLPQQGMNPQAAPSYQPNGRGPLDLTASDADLQAFEQNFGDIPL